MHTWNDQHEDSKTQRLKALPEEHLQCASLSLCVFEHFALRTSAPCYRMYFSIIGASSVFFCSGTNSGLVIMAVASASLQAHVLGPGMRPTASAIVFCA